MNNDAHMPNQDNLTEHFTISAAQPPLIDESYVIQKHRSTDSRAMKLCYARTGENACGKVKTKWAACSEKFGQDDEVGRQKEKGG